MAAAGPPGRRFLAAATRGSRIVPRLYGWSGRVDTPLVGDGTDEIQAVMPGGVDHALVPGAAIIFDFDPGIVAWAESLAVPTQVPSWSSPPCTTPHGSGLQPELEPSDP